MANPFFNLGANTLTFSKGPDYPVAAPMEQLQVIDRTAAGTLEVETLGAIIKTLPLSFSNLTQTDYDNLVYWFEVIASGAANVFIYSDVDENDFFVRWVNQFNFTENKAGYSGRIELEIV